VLDLNGANFQMWLLSRIVLPAGVDSQASYAGSLVPPPIEKRTFYASSPINIHWRGDRALLCCEARSDGDSWPTR